MKKKESTLRHFFNIGWGTLISVIISVITTPIITRLIDPTSYGKFSIFQLYASISLMVLCFGLDQSLMRFYYDYDDIKYKRKLFVFCTKIPIITTLIVSFGVLILIYLGIIKLEFSFFEIFLLSLCVILEIVNRMSLVALRLEFKSKIFSIINILHKLFYVICVITLFYLKRIDSVIVLILSTIIAYGVSVLIAVFYQKELWKINCSKNININIKKVIKYGLPFVISMGITTFFQAIDKISLKYFNGYSDVGIYASAITIVNIFAIIQTTFNSLWTPLALKHYKNNKNDKNFFIKVNKIITVIMFSFGLTLILFKDLIGFFLGKQYRLAAYILPCLIFNPIMYTISETTVCGITFKEKSNKHLIIAFISCIVNIVGNIILVPLLNGKGAAISTGISYIVFFVTRSIASQKYFKVDYAFDKIAIITFFTFLYALYNTFFKFNYLSIIFYIVIILILFFEYKDTVLYIFQYIKSIIKNIKLNSKEKKEGM